MNKLTVAKFVEFLWH